EREHPVLHHLAEGELGITRFHGAGLAGAARLFKAGARAGRKIAAHLVANAPSRPAEGWRAGVAPSLRAA
ncbi:MAG: hypothetical protein ACJ8C3_22300, partial [Microvirga sp.]